MLHIHFHNGSNYYKLPLNNNKNTTYFYKYNFNNNILGNNFLHSADFGKGFSFINGFNLNSFGNLGPINQLHIPSPIIKKGINKIIIFETKDMFSSSLTLSNKPLYMK